MSRCEIKSGFFVISECQRLASATCDNCGRYTCDRHMRRRPNGKLWCVECYAKQDYQHDGQVQKKEYDPNWDMGTAYYWTYHSREVYYNDNDYEAFDLDDYEGFENEGALVFDDENETGGFWDS